GGSPPAPPRPARSREEAAIAGSRFSPWPRRPCPNRYQPSLCNAPTTSDDTAGLLRWEVWRALPSKKYLVLRLVRAAKPPEPGAKKKRLWVRCSAPPPA